MIELKLGVSKATNVRPLLFIYFAPTLKIICLFVKLETSFKKITDTVNIKLETMYDWLC